MFTEFTADKLVYTFKNAEGKEFNVNYTWTTDKDTAKVMVDSLKGLIEKDSYTIRQELLDRKLINTNKGLVLDVFSKLDKEFNFVKEVKDEDEEVPF